MFAGIPSSAIPGGRVAAWALRLLGCAGAVAIAVAWWRASETVRVEQQVEWAPLGLAGASAISLALLLSFVAARQAVAVRLRRLAPALEKWNGPAGTDDESPSGDLGPLVAAGNMARYHRGSCPLAAGKPVRTGSRTDHEAAGRRPCGVCES